MPQSAWSSKRERQYEHIKESEQKQGRSTKRAKEIAARTVNKERARSGETKGRGSRTSTRDLSSGRRGGLRSGTKRPKGRTKEQLYNEAKRKNIPGRSRMTKAQLQRAVDRRKRLDVDHGATARLAPWSPRPSTTSPSGSPIGSRSSSSRRGISACT
jgi:hypothetical protein